jgi:ATP-binding protein involved in chromosome partitioning
LRHSLVRQYHRSYLWGKRTLPLKIFQAKEKATTAVIAVAAGKGGVGKSTVTVNLALALKQLGLSVGILDSDIYGPSIRKMLPEERMPSQQGDRLIPALCQGIKMISMAYFRRDHEAAAVRAPIANGLVTQFIRNVDWGELDYLLIDFPPGTGDIQLTLSQQANLTGAVMVTTPQEVALLDVRKAMHLFQQVQIPIVGIVENLSYYQRAPDEPPLYLFGKGGGERLAKESGVPFLGAIPVDPAVSECGDAGLSLLANYEASPAARAFIRLAEQLVAHTALLQSTSRRCLTHFELIWKES